ncbi:Unknown protein [Striga hermonthica]|uniref:U1-type domain-containing protein n=1 Tax=Striga hermonthica TaxID=68872 RepID=A0A9N7ND78_STRHE|nr:Unknown protein [Striga hermonthica]
MEQDKEQMHHPLFTSNSQDLRRAVLIEMEKEKIREEMMVSEIARKRVLEAEVRSELLRWVQAMGGRGLPLSFWSSLPTELVPPTRLSDLGESGNGSFLDERVRVLMDEAKKEKHEGVGFETSPFHGRTGGLRIPEVKPVCREGSEGKKLILLGKPDGNVSGLKGKEVKADNNNARFQTLPFVSYADLGVSSEIKPVPSGLDEKQTVKGKLDEKITGLKRKSMSPPPPPQVSSGIWNKKPKEDWSCSICNINCTGQRNLDSHLQGRKHKVKVAALGGKKAGGQVMSQHKDMMNHMNRIRENDQVVENAVSNAQKVEVDITEGDKTTEASGEPVVARVAEIENIAENENKGLINYGVIVPYVQPYASDAGVENLLIAEDEKMVETNEERVVDGDGEIENITETENEGSNHSGSVVPQVQPPAPGPDVGYEGKTK